jgi:hypothetical protein
LTVCLEFWAEVVKAAGHAAELGVDATDLRLCLV